MRGIAAIMIAMALALSAGRIAVVLSAEGDTAFLSANDRSRWATVAALVEDGKFEIDRLMAIRDPSGRRRPWQSIDRVRHTGTDGVMHDYSSKPPLYTILVAAVYAAVKAVSGMTLTAQPIYLTRIVLAIVNLPTLAVFLLSTWSVIRRSNVNEIAQLTALAFACFGTMLLPMSVSLGNHLPAAAATAAVMAIYLSVGRTDRSNGLPQPASGRGRQSTAAAFAAGWLAAFTVACELPALLMLVLWSGLFMRQSPRATIVGFIPGALLVAAAFFATNWAAHRSLIPPYAHRGDGPLIAGLKSEGVPAADRLHELLLDAGAIHPVNREQPLRLTEDEAGGRWVVETANGNQRFVLRRGVASGVEPGVEPAAEAEWKLFAWDHWYDYPGSYWMTERSGVDRGEPSRRVYAFHATLGHHGIFSITPFWLLALLGCFLRLRDRTATDCWWLAIAILLATLICFAFYISRPLIDRNYGGVSCCFRWLLWFAPLWIWLAVPACERLMGNRVGRWLVTGTVAASLFSVSTALESPWQHPWIYRYFDFLGWLGG